MWIEFTFIHLLVKNFEMHRQTMANISTILNVKYKYPACDVKDMGYGQKKTIPGGQNKTIRQWTWIRNYRLIDRTLWGTYTIHEFKFFVETQINFIEINISVALILRTFYLNFHMQLTSNCGADISYVVICTWNDIRFGQNGAHVVLLEPFQHLTEKFKLCIECITCLCTSPMFYPFIKPKWTGWLICGRIDCVLSFFLLRMLWNFVWFHTQKKAAHISIQLIQNRFQCIYVKCCGIITVIVIWCITSGPYTVNTPGHFCILRFTYIVRALSHPRNTRWNQVVLSEHEILVSRIIRRIRQIVHLPIKLSLL